MSGKKNIYVQQSNHNEILEKPKSIIDRILTLILVILIITSVVMLAYVIFTPKQGEKFTEFYILGPDGIAHDYPTNILLNESGTVIIGVVNHEYRMVNYSLEILLDNESLSQDPLPIVLAHNQTWERNVTFTPTRPGTGMKLQIILFKDGNFTESYRDLYLLIDVTEGSN
jgi:uncharacterized membrane protein